MAIQRERTRPSEDPAPSLQVSPESYLFPSKIQVIGFGWSGCPVEFLLDDKERVRPAIVLRGEASRDAVRPVAGEFIALFNFPDLRAGAHRIVAVEKRRGRRIQQSATFTLLKVPTSGKDGDPHTDGSVAANIS